MRKIGLLTALLLTYGLSLAQGNTDIFLFDVDFSKGKLENGTNLTHWKGYDNQPSFSADGSRIYFTRLFSDQSDAYYYDMNRRIIREFTATSESEYSPTLTPDGKFISVIMVEQDSTQRLWKYPIEMGEPELIFENVKPVGYHSWIDNNTVAMFILGDENSLQIGDTRTGKAKLVASNIGRSIHTFAGSVFFVHKESDSKWSVKKYNVADGQTSTLGTTFRGREDFTVTRSGKIIMGDGEKIYQLKSGKWKKVFTIKNDNFVDFNRMVFSPDERKLALVTVMP